MSGGRSFFQNSSNNLFDCSFCDVGMNEKNFVFDQDVTYLAEYDTASVYLIDMADRSLRSTFESYPSGSEIIKVHLLQDSLYIHSRKGRDQYIVVKNIESSDQIVHEFKGVEVTCMCTFFFEDTEKFAVLTS